MWILNTAVADGEYTVCLHSSKNGRGLGVFAHSTDGASEFETFACVL